MESVSDELTEQQRNALKQFRENLNVDLNSSHTDELLVKFLRARNFNLRAAEKIFLENYYNRITFGVNTILDTYEKPEVAQKYETTSFIGFAKDGSLIRYTAAGRLDFYGFIMSMSCLDLCLYFSHLTELDIKTMKEENLRTGKNVSEITYVIDLEEFSIQQVLHKNVIEMGLDFVRLIQDCYPEIWRHVLIVNAPKFFDKAFNLFKSVMRSTVLNRIRLATKDNSKSLLLKYIDEDVLPAFLGGNRVDSKGDSECKEFISFGGKVPEKFYSQNRQDLLSLDDPEVRCITIGPRSACNVSAVIHEPGSKVRLQGRTENGSIYVSLFYREFCQDSENPKLPGEFERLDENSEYKQISVEIRAQMNSCQEDGLVLLPWPGIYVLRFSNASNWFTSTKLYIKNKIIPPESKLSS